MPAFAQSEQSQLLKDTFVIGKAEEEEIFMSVEQMPEFPGGMDGLLKYLSGNVRYPKEAYEANIQGKVIIQFVISNMGKITNAVVKYDPGAGCGEEALRVVRNMPDWKPGKQNGQAVNVYYVLPINFKLTNDEPERVKNKE